MEMVEYEPDVDQVIDTGGKRFPMLVFVLGRSPGEITAIVKGETAAVFAHLKVRYLGTIIDPFSVEAGLFPTDILAPDDVRKNNEKYQRSEQSHHKWIILDVLYQFHLTISLKAHPQQLLVIPPIDLPVVVTAPRNALFIGKGG
jgi:hypothetical protein